MRPYDCIARRVHWGPSSPGSNQPSPVNEARGTPGLSVWQRNYPEHIIRNEDELNSVRQYITENPEHWEVDDENPACLETGPAGLMAHILEGGIVRPGDQVTIV